MLGCEVDLTPNPNTVNIQGQLAVNTRTVLAFVPPQGCESILIEILQSKRSAGGPHFTCCFLKSIQTYNRSRYIIEILTLILLCRDSFV